MQCPDCYGTGMIVRRGDGPFFPVCEACGGYGMVHCCEGDRAADPPADGPPPPEVLQESRTRVGGVKSWRSAAAEPPGVTFNAAGQG